MAKPDWGKLQQRFLSDHAKTGISPKTWCEAQGLNYDTARRYIKKVGAQKTAQKDKTPKLRKETAQKADKPTPVKAKKEIAQSAQSDNAQKPQETKPEQKRKVVTNHPPFQKGNQHALKHGGYGRRMLLSDAVSEDAQSLTLSDELFWLRAGNLTAAENIGRWKAELEDEPTEEKRKLLMSNIGAAYKAMHRNTVRIESLERTISGIRVAESLAHVQVPKIEADTNFRNTVTEKTELEIEQLRKELNQSDKPGGLEDDYQLQALTPDEPTPDSPIL
ncbi:hypothetical protein [Limnobaculum xujianqingii]|uniref:hypothetical protein n=1 Tax=Limnobaculum xujianqingii TaxID=2738837 RepID=UPI001E500A4D|nr:hypothetical protein [Limnobaculum xujianqingii]